MEIYKKYRTIYRISYIAFLAYLLIISIGNFNLGEHAPYFLVVPFLLYCLAATIMEILIRRERKLFYENKKKKTKDLHTAIM
ncbi:putative ferric reductase [Dysgonomonas sp. PFB1-18]|uniref:hypothetical protein n=1 Tax=unclassified Dysgonomonas TaxID=2630389 RepID=UPI0024749430|nr:MULTISPECIES: hypothetical protein [unclassified Dysgonomonas]MDH6309325.1 putative ferric reductase [Dysgonomonas sp. PF1-14]MDH6339810.1 putative ferric reductase [Dysgonomonas sp. PF1-16]MDH6381458.1 putative ferric reductase [Dysgonomonas sp. PFB1-18]MDH6398673.1 putative ferric reductase [Dysgonomonas sp. PF1-23]